MASGRELKRHLVRLLFTLFRHPRITGSVLLILAAVSLVSIFAGTFRNDVSRMLPDGSEAARCYEIIARSSMFNKAPILFHAEDPGLFRTAAFSEKLERLVRLLESDERILRVDYRLLPGTPEEILSELVSYVPQYLPFSSLPEPAAAVAECRRQFLLPGGTGRSRLLESDPFSLASRLLLPLEHFRRVSRFSSAPDSPYLVSPDGRSLLILLETAVPATDPGSGRALLSFAEAQLREAGFVPGKDAELLFPHRRAMANEAVVKADILQVSFLSLVIFSLLTIFIYRCDFRAFLIPAVPFLSALFTTALMPLVFRTPLFFIVGMGGIVISLALDYGIHMYAAMTGRGSFRSLTKILTPLLFAALTSGAAFLLFLFGATDAVRQLGFFSGVSLLLSLLLMLLILPPAFAHRKGQRNGPPVLRQRGFPPLPPRAVRIVWLILIAVSAALIPGLRVYSDARQFDLSPPEYEEQDAALIRTFQGGAAPAMALFRGETAEQAKDAAEAAGSVPECFSVSELYPRESVREKNQEEWRAFEKRSWAEWTERLRAEADKNDFDPEFFTPFLNRLRQGILDPPADPPVCFRPVLDRLLVRGTDGLWTAAALYPETPETAARLSSLPGAVVIARDHFAEILARDLTHGILPLAIGAVISVLFLTWLFFRSVRDTFLALLPVFSSLLFTGALFSLLGKPVTVPVLTAAIILCGLAVDYGIFAVHAIRTGNTDNIFRAVTLSALTTAAGGLTVAFTRHPMLHSAGQTLIAGIGFAWFSALFLLPALVSEKRKKGVPACCFLLLLLPVFLTGCRTEPFEYESFPPVCELAGSRTKIPFPDNFSILGSVVMETPFFAMDFLCAAERKDGFFRIAGLSPGGVKLFETAGKLGEVSEFYFTPAAEMPGDPREHAETLLRQFEYIFEGLGPCPDSVLKAAEPVMDGTAMEKDGRRWAGKNLDLIEKEKAGYYLYRNFGGFRFPVHIVYRGDWGYRLIFRISEAEAL